ncbi:response regulator transcription factor [Miniphocaeibacter massiliensis]|uniref:response regulator transcription factor n=1 Tax=Miniphocaeibacter massiliensis TaxID=2041841 RepID=UPI000C08A99C|nr:response regulator transcription factor [Miniphocaeibacter massiliensis]
MKNILLVEDEETLNRSVTFLLEKEGYTLFSAKNLEDAKDKFENNNINLIISDINLPDGNGLDFIKYIRKSSNIHIICLTALDQEFDHIMGYEAGADDYITKPFSLSVLLLKVNAYFKRKKSNNRNVIKSGDIKFSVNEMKVIKEDVEIELTKNELKLLKFFMENPKQVLSKKQLLENLFDSDSNFVEENTVAVNISRLRDKIEVNPKKPEIIKNLRGIGYIWNQECTKDE